MLYYQGCPEGGIGVKEVRALRLVTSESVTEGHPDKLADRISDAILDALIAQDKKARVAAETLVTTGLVFVAGEITTEGYVDIPNLVRKTVREVGYTRAKYGFDADTCAVLTAIDEQSPDIAGGVNLSYEWRVLKSTDPLDRVGAGDQGLMFGYATDETPELMPLPITLAHRLTMRLAEVRKTGLLPYLRPDGKAQVTVVYEGDKPLYVKTVVVSAQHSPEVEQEQLREDLIREVVRQAIPPEYLKDGETEYLINPSGRFILGGPHADTGLTGRKIIVDTYGGAVPHGGGAFSGKDPTKVDRSASYYARYMAKNIVAAGLARRALVELAYAIGKARPVSLRVETFGTGVLPDEKLTEIAKKVFDPRPLAIIEELDLLRPIYTPTSAYGHFGRPGFPWEETDRVEALRREAGLWGHPMLAQASMGVSVRASRKTLLGPSPRRKPRWGTYLGAASTRFFPLRLARYMASSARRRRVRGVSVGRASATPKLAVIRATGGTAMASTARRRRSARRRAWGRGVSGRRRANSSPPRRTARSLRRRWASRRWARAWSTRSPTSCPWRSFTALKPSRSRRTRERGRP